MKKQLLDSPKNQKAEVLFELLQNDSISRMSIMNETGILNLTARISDLRIRHNLDIRCRKVLVKNKHGRPVSYGKWSLPEIQISDGLLIYQEINK